MCRPTRVNRSRALVLGGSDWCGDVLVGFGWHHRRRGAVVLVVYGEMFSGKHPSAAESTLRGFERSRDGWYCDKQQTRLYARGGLRTVVNQCCAVASNDSCTQQSVDGMAYGLVSCYGES